LGFALGKGGKSNNLFCGGAGKIKKKTQNTGQRKKARKGTGSVGRWFKGEFRHLLQFHENRHENRLM